MADDIDRARRMTEFTTSVKLAEISAQAATPVAKWTGRCLYCDKPTEQGRRWCDAECCQAWSRDNDATR